MKKLLFILIIFLFIQLKAQSNNALSLDGVNDLVTIPASINAQISSNITVEGWFNFSGTGTSNYAVIIGENYPLDNNYKFAIFRNGTNISAGFYNVGFKLASSPLPPLNKWIHIAATYDQQSIKLYYDGILKSSFPITTPLTNGLDNWTIGKRGNSTDYVGMISDEIRIWNVARTQTEIQNAKDCPLTLPQTNLVAYYDFNQGIPEGNNSGLITLLDKTGNFNGTLSNFVLNGPVGNWVGNSFENISYNSVCIGENTTFNVSSIRNITSYSWDFGDVASGSSNFSTLANPNHQFNTLGTFQVKLAITLAGGCSDTLIKSISVNTKPTASFTSSINCFNFQFTSTSTSSSPITNYLWDFGDGTSSILANPLKQFATAGNFSVKLKVTNQNGCIDSTTQIINVTNPTIVDFAISNTCLGNTTSFTNLSIGLIDSVLWKFGDGNISTSLNATNQYSTLGSYTAKLYVYRGVGCIDSLTKTVIISNKPTATYNYTGNLFTNQILQFNNTSVGTTWFWDFGDGSTDTTKNPSHIFTQSGIYNVKLVANIGTDCKDSLTQTLTIISLNNALNFDGVNDKVTLPANLGSNFTSNTITIEGWYNVANFGTSTLQLYLIGEGSTDGSVKFAIYKDGTNLKAGFGTTASISTNAAKAPLPLTNKWVHIAATYDQSIIKLYYDGILVDSFLTNLSLPTGNDLWYLGSHWNGASIFLNSSMDEIRIWNVARTQSEIQNAKNCPLSLPQTGLVAYYDFNQGIPGGTNTGLTTLIDKIGNNNGTLSSFALTGSTSNWISNNNSEISNTTACLGENVTFSCSTTKSVLNYNWNFGDPGSGTNNTATTTLSTFDHIFSSAGNFNVTQIINLVGGCSDTLIKSISVNTKPTASFTSSINCFNFQFTSTSISSSPITNYLWDFGDGSTSFLANPVKQYATAGNFSVKLKVTNQNGCIDSTTQIINVTNPTIVDFAINNTCLGNTTSFTNLSIGLIDSVLWVFGDGNISNSLNTTNQYSTLGSYTTKLYVYRGVGCIDSLTKTITISNKPTVAYNYTGNLFSNQTIQFNNTSVGTTWFWDFGDGSTDTTKNPSHIFTQSGIYNVKLVVNVGSDCKDSLTQILTIISLDNALDLDGVNDKISLPANLGSNFTTNTITIEGWYNFTNFGSSTLQLYLIGEGSTDGSVKFAIYKDGTNIKAGFGTTALVSANSAKAPLPATNKWVHIAATYDQTSIKLYYDGVLKDSLLTNLSIPTGNDLWYLGSHWNGGTTFLNTKMDEIRIWNVARTQSEIQNAKNCPLSLPQTGLVAYYDFNQGIPGGTNTGLTTLIDKIGNNNGTLSSFGLTGTTSNWISNNNSEISNTTACLGENVTFSCSTTKSVLNYNWNFGDPGSGTNNTATTTLSTFDHIFSSAGNFNVTQIINLVGGCSDTLIKAITVTTKPTASFTSSINCFNFQFTSTSTSSSPITNYLWDFGDGTSSILANPVKQFATAGNFTVKLKVTNQNGCFDSTTQITNVTNPTLVDFAISNTCLGNTTSFTNLSIGLIDSVLWEFGDGNISTSLNATNQYSTLGSYTAKLYVYRGVGCIDSLTKTITISNKPTVAYNYTGSLFTNQTIQFNNTSVGTTWYWDFGDGSTDTTKNPSHIFTQSGIYNVKLVVNVGSDCKDSLTQTLTIISLNNALNFDGVNDYVTLPSTINSQFANNKITIEGWFKLANDGSTNSMLIGESSADGNVKFALYRENFKIKAGFSNGIFVTVDANIPAFDKWFHIAATYDKSKIRLYFNGVTVDSVAATASLPPGTGSWYLGRRWDNTNYLNAEMDNIRIWNVARTKSQIINSKDCPLILPQTGLIALFDFDHGLPGATNTGINNLTDRTGNNYNGVLSNFALTGPKSNWVQTFSDEIIINNQQYCEGLVSFSFNSIVVDTLMNLTYLWNFGGLSSSTSRNPVAYFPNEGTYTVSLDVINPFGCSFTTSKDITISPKPQADFTFITGCANTPVQFTDQSIISSSGSIVLRKWDFGNNSTPSYDINPVYAYPVGGTYNVKLITTSDKGCLDTVVKTIFIPKVDFDFTSTCFGNSISFTSDIQYPGDVVLNQEWNFGDGTIDNNLNSVHFYTSIGTYKVVFKVVTQNGCTDSIVKTIDVIQAPNVDFRVNSSTCTNVPVLFENLTTSGSKPVDQWIWAITNTSGGLDTINTQNATYTFSTAGNYQIILTIIISGCSTTVNKLITISETPIADFSLPIVCKGMDFSINNLSTFAQSDPEKAYYWLLPDNQYSTLKNPILDINQTGVYDITLTSFSLSGCSDSKTITFNVDPQPVANFINSVDTGDYPLLVNFTSDTTSVYTYEWSFGDGSTSNLQNPNYIYNSEGTFTARLIVSSLNGCKDTLEKNIVVLVPITKYFDIELLEINSVNIDNKTRVSAKVKNNSNVLVNKITAKADLNREYFIYETWFDSLMPLETKTIFFNGNFETNPIDGLKFICVELSKPNDSTEINISNNIQCNAIEKEISVIAFPNPAYDNINVQIIVNSDDNIEIEILNELGQSDLKFFNGLIYNGLNSFNVDLSSFSKGMYVLKVIYKGKIYITKFSKV